jgi:hypothetical protein
MMLGDILSILDTDRSKFLLLTFVQEACPSTNRYFSLLGLCFILDQCPIAFDVEVSSSVDEVYLFTLEKFQG